MGRDTDGRADFDVFYAETHASLVAHLYALTGDFGEAQEAAQETYIRAWNDWDRIHHYENPVAWIRLVGRRVAVSRWRRTRTALKSWIRHGPDRDVAAPGPESVALVAALREIPEAQRRAVVMHHMGGLSVSEIAAQEGVPEGTVKARLSRGRVALAALLRDGSEPIPAARRTR